MTWYIFEFTHYVGEAALEAMIPDDLAEGSYETTEADSLADVLRRIEAIEGYPLAQLDDSDSGLGGVFTNRRYARRYWKLNDHTTSAVRVWAIIAKEVLA